MFKHVFKRGLRVAVNEPAHNEQKLTHPHVCPRVCAHDKQNKDPLIEKLFHSFTRGLTPHRKSLICVSDSYALSHVYVLWL